MSIGNNIKSKREQLGWTQEELAEKMGYKSRSTINKIELGINDVSQQKIKKFAEVLHCSIAYLMDWEEAEDKKTLDFIDFNENAPIILQINNELAKMDKKKLSSLLLFLQSDNGGDSNDN